MSDTLGSANRPVRIAVVGSGPSGFYAVAALFKQTEIAVEVDVFDRLPTPYGLVRGGVAPDHQSIKNVIRVYEKAAAQENFRFFGNVKIGSDLQVAEVEALYDQVVFAIGNESHRAMGVPGEDLKGVFSATEFVGWYNGHPDFSDLDFALETTRRVAVVGNGNVAMDVARVLAKDPEELATTDMAGYAVDALRKSAVREIFVLGRRGPAQAAFTTKEIKEVGSLPGVDVIVPRESAELDTLSQSWLDEKGSRGAKKNVEYLLEKSAEQPQGHERRMTFHFLVSPVEFIGENGRLRAVRLDRNELFEDAKGTPRPRALHERWTEDVDLVLTAVGYRGVPLPGLPFREDWAIVPNEAGRVLGDDGKTKPGLYVAGWAKRGPTGLIGSNVADAKETVEHMLDDVRSGEVPPIEDPSPDDIVNLLGRRGVRWISFAEWRKLDGIEVAKGLEHGKIREKFSDVASMLAALDED
jgi:ferredoxin--NADP+ reductase